MSDVLIRDRTGSLCSAEQARVDIRRSLGNSTDEAIATNAAGQVHHSQVAGVAKYVRMQRRMVYFVMSIPALAVTIGAPAAASANGDSIALGWGAFGFVAIAATTVALARRVGRNMQVQTVVGRIEGLGGGGVVGAGQARLADTRFPVDARWIGMPVVAYRVKCGMTEPLYLSGDLEIARVVPAVPNSSHHVTDPLTWQPTSLSAATERRPTRLMRRRCPMWLSKASTTLAVTVPCSRWPPSVPQQRSGRLSRSSEMGSNASPARQVSRSYGRSLR
jgi:hypothetical protein